MRFRSEKLVWKIFLLALRNSNLFKRNYSCVASFVIKTSTIKSSLPTTTTTQIAPRFRFIKFNKEVSRISPSGTIARKTNIQSSFYDTSEENRSEKMIYIFSGGCFENLLYRSYSLANSYSAVYSSYCQLCWPCFLGISWISLFAWSEFLKIFVSTHI